MAGRRKPRMGRPPKPAAERRSRAVTVWMTDAAYAAAAAAAAGRPLSDWMNELAELATRKTTPSV